MGPEDVKNSPSTTISENVTKPESMKKTTEDRLIMPKSPPINQEKTSRKVDYIKLEKELKAEVKKFPGTVGLIFYDLSNNKKIEINPNEVFESASLVKLPVMVEIYNQVDKDKIKPGMELTLRKSDKVGGSGVLKNKPAHSLWKVSKLVELMIVQSDNTATDMLINLAGMEDVEKTARSLGMKKTTLKRKIFAFHEIDKGKDNYTTPNDMLILLKELNNGNKIKKEYREKMLEILKNQKRNSMLPRNLPKGAKCAHKTGSLLGILHDVGIIYPPKEKPYILILMGENVTDQKLGEKVFADISGKVYKYLFPSINDD